MVDTTRLLLVDDHPCIHVAVRHQLRERQDFQLFGAASCEEALQLAGEVRPHVVITDLTLGSSASGVELAAKLRRLWPTSRVIIYTASEPSRFWPGACKAGAMGFVLKVSDTCRLIDAIDRVLQGEEYRDPAGSLPRAVRVYSFASRLLNEASRALTVAGKVTVLGPTTTRFLCYLLDARVDRGDAWLSFEELQRELYATSSPEMAENVTQVKCEARRALEDPALIETRVGSRRSGVPSAYRLRVTVERRTFWPEVSPGPDPV